jgi:predicted urease superfamily metal-dependent hydrolase
MDRRWIAEDGLGRADKFAAEDEVKALGHVGLPYFASDAATTYAMAAGASRRRTATSG